MSVAFILNPGYNTINNIHHTFWDQGADCVANDSLNQALEVSTSVKAPIHVVGDTHTISATAGGIITDAPQFEIPIVISSQVNTDTLLPNLSTTGISVQADLVLDDTTITGVSELTCGTLHYTTLDPAIVPGDASAWSEYPATQAVDLASQSLTSSTRSYISIPKNLISVATTADSGETSSIIGNSVNNSILNASLSVVTNQGRAGASECTLKVVPTNRAFGVSYSDNPGSSTLSNSNSGTAGDLQLSSSTSGKYRILYSTRSKAITVNQSGALAFDSTFSGGVPVEGSFGTAGQIIQSNGPSAAVSWVDAPAPGDPSTWSEYPATERVDLVTYGLKSATTNVDFTNGLSLNGVNSDIIANSSSNTDSDSNTATITIGTTGETYSQFRMRCNSGLQTVKSNRGFQFSAGSGAMSTANNRDIVFASGDPGSIFTANIRFAYDGSSKAYTINKDGALNFDANWNGTDPIIEGSFGTSGQIIQSNGSAAAPSWVSLPVSSQYVYYVSKDGTVGASGDVSHPLSTIQAAITLGQAAYPRQVVILIAPGVYSETLSITLPNITLSGYSISQQQNLMTQIAGNVGVSCSASQDLFYSQVCIQNLQISGLLYDNSSVVHTLNVEGCRISSNGAVFAQLSTSDNRTRLTRCTILQSSTTASTDPVLKFSSGLITLSLLDVTARNNAPVLQFDGSAKLQACGLCTFESNTTSATAAPIVYIAPTSAAGYTYAFGYNSFSYPSLVPRAFSSGKNCGIVCEAGTGHPTLFITYNSFNLLLCDATCFVVQDVKKADAAAYTNISFFSNSSTYLATGIDSTHKTTLAAVA